MFQGPRSACAECALVLEAQAIPYRLLAIGEHWALATGSGAADRARAELLQYAREARPPSIVAPAFQPFPGAAAGAAGYAVVLLFVAYAAGTNLFAADWFAVGAVDASPAARHEWWRALTALTLHVGPEHLFGNLFFGGVAGGLCSHLIGPGLAWLSVLLAGGAANELETWLAPAEHRAVGASTAVFAALGLLAGFAWRQRLSLRERWLYRFAPLFAGVCLLALLGSGAEHVEHVDVLGHLLGFGIGVVCGFVHAELRVPRRHTERVQLAAGVVALALICGSWWLALGR